MREFFSTKTRFDDVFSQQASKVFKKSDCSKYMNPQFRDYLMKINDKEANMEYLEKASIKP